MNNHNHLVPISYDELFSKLTISGIEKFSLPEKFITNSVTPSQTSLESAFNAAKDRGNCFLINFNKLYLVDGITDEESINGKRLKKPIVAMNIILGIDNKVFCIDVDSSELKTIPIVVRVSSEFEPVIKIKLGDEYYAKLNFLYGLFLTGRKGKKGRIMSSDIAYMVSVSPSTDTFSKCEAVMLPNCEAPYDFLNAIKCLLRYIDKGDDDHGHV